MLVEKIEFKETKITDIQVTTILYKKKKEEGIKVTTDLVKAMPLTTYC